VPGARSSDREHTLPFPFQYTACPRFRLHPCHLEWVRAHSAAMNENLRSILTGTAALWLGAAIALLLTILRGPVDGDLAGREQTARLFLLGLAVQSLHFMEEFVTHFPERFPALLGLPPWSESFFVTFNLIWLRLTSKEATGWLSSRCGFLPLRLLPTGSRTLCSPSYLMDISPGLSPPQYLEF
jgi:hypothetical protein